MSEHDRPADEGEQEECAPVEVPEFQSPEWYRAKWDYEGIDREDERW